MCASSCSATARHSKATPPRWRGAGRFPFAPRDGRTTLQSMHLVIDALFGAGLSRPLEGDGRRAGGRRQRERPAGLAVDVPSGLDGTTGTAPGVCIQATRTVTFFRMKPGHVLLPGAHAVRRGHRGADIGIPERVLDEHRTRTCMRTRRSCGSRIIPGRRMAATSTIAGHAVVVSGPAHRRVQRGSVRGARCASAPAS